MVNKLSSYSASNITTLRRVLPFGIILVVIAASLATQVTAYYYRYPAEFGLPILSLGDIRLYQPLQFFIWAINYPNQKGISYGWGAFSLSIIISFGGLFFLWFKSIIKERSSDVAYGTAAWGDPIDPKYGLNQKNGLVLGKDKNNRYLIDNRDTHAIIAAATGSGKTAGPAILTLLSYEGSMVITDVKGELFALTSGARSKFSDIHSFNPLSSDPKTKINPLLLVRPGLDAIEDCTVMASAIIPREIKPGEEHWISKGREWVTSMILYILHCEDRKNVHLGYLYNLVCQRDSFGELMRRCKTSREHDPEGEIEKYIKSTAEGIIGTPDREAGSIKSTMVRHLDFFRNPKTVASICESTLNLRDMLVAKRPQTLYITVPPTELHAVGPIIRVIFDMCCRILLEKEPRRCEPEKIKLLLWNVKKIKNTLSNLISPVKENLFFFRTWPKLKDRHNVMFLIDEAPQYGKMETIENKIGLLRSYGVRVVMITQAMAILHKIYGENSQIFYNCGVRLFFGTNDIAEAKSISELVGTTTSGFWSKSFNKSSAAFLPEGESRQANRFARQLLNADEILRINELEGAQTGILIIQGNLPMKIKNAFHFQDERILSYTKQPPAVVNPQDIIHSLWHDVIIEREKTVGRGSDEEIFFDGKRFHNTPPNKNNDTGDTNEDTTDTNDLPTDVETLQGQPSKNNTPSSGNVSEEELKEHNRDIKKQEQIKLQKAATNAFNQMRRNPPVSSVRNGSDKTSTTTYNKKKDTKDTKDTNKPPTLPVVSTNPPPDSQSIGADIDAVLYSD